MKMRNRSWNLVSVAIVAIAVFGCSDSGEATNPHTNTGSSESGGSGAGPAGTGGDDAMAPTGGVTTMGGTPGTGGAGATGASQATGGSTPATGGSAAGGAPTGGAPTGGATTGGAPTGGAETGGAETGGAETGGAEAGGTETGGAATGGTTGDGCTIGPWPAADPATAGPFTVATDEEVGPQAGDPEEDGTVPRFTMFRPENMDESGLCHPVITWGNGTGSTPDMYGTLLRHFASHGFVVIGSNSTNVSRGDPKPMNVGIDWVLEQTEDPSRVLYHRIDTTNIGATGHSQGAMATSQASADERITTSVPIEGAMVQRNLHGPAMFFCGGQDDIVGCDGARSALDAVNTLPAMYAEYLTVDHGSWLTFFGNTHTDVEVAITAWMRVHLMADDSLRSWFYGPSCGLCTDSGWEIDRKNMDQ